MNKLFSFLLLLSLISNLWAEVPPFESHLFKKGTLVHADDFVGELNRERWEHRSGTRWEVQGG